MTAAVVAAGATATWLAPGGGPASDVAFDAARSSAGSALLQDLRSISPARWDLLAEDVESGRELILAIVDPTATVPQVTVLVTSVLDAWRRVGLDLRTLASLTVTTTAGLEERSPSDAVRVLTRLAQVAGALDEVRAEG